MKNFKRCYKIKIVHTTFEECHILIHIFRIHFKQLMSALNIKRLSKEISKMCNQRLNHKDVNHSMSLKGFVGLIPYYYWGPDD